ncbi:lysylphosphatidylglycerol synthase transmembrane domain-containing protein [Aeromicrobium camelliae]|nr:lysylphosphatidylglycerol synthase transmembrane domain-containing protein [Aeromicrobium camelliae]
MKLVRIGGIVLGVLALTLCIRAIVQEWADISTAVRRADVRWLVAALALSGASMASLGVLWQRCLAVFGHRTPLGATISWYFAGELGKYVPGGVWAVLGRGELAYRLAGVPRSVAYGTTLVSYGTMCLSAAFVCAALIPWVFVGGGDPGWYVVTVVLVPLGVGIVHPVPFGRILALGRRATGGKLDLHPARWGQMIALIVWGIPAWLLLGGAAWCIAQALAFPGRFPDVAFAAVTAWILGFLLFPVPAGAGVREVVFIALAGLSAGPAAAIALVSRVALMIADGIGGLVGLAGISRRVGSRDLRHFLDNAESQETPDEKC